MEPVSILMFIFSAAIELWALITALTKSTSMIPYRYRHSAKMEDKKAYMTRFAKILALVGTVPAAGGIVANWSGAACAIVMTVGLAVTLWLGTKYIK